MEVGGRRMSKVWEERKNRKVRGKVMQETDSVGRRMRRRKGQRENTECDSSN